MAAEIADALLENTPNETVWAERVVEMGRSIFPDAVATWLHIVEYDRDDRVKRHRLSVPVEYGEHVESSLGTKEDARCPAGLFFDPPRPRSAARGLPVQVRLVAQPAEHVSTCVVWSFDSPPAIGRLERQSLERLAFHLEVAQRVRERPETLRAILSDHGAIDYLQESRYDVWPALLEGRVSLVARRIEDRHEYLVLENSVTARRERALSLAETATLRLASQGMSNKLMAYGLGISATAVSRNLASAATKLGLASRTELIRVAALLVQDRRTEMGQEELTSAEREVLVLVQRGMSNLQIAKLRARSVRTIANQVASLLRKTGAGSRRELAVRRDVERTLSAT